MQKKLILIYFVIIMLCGCSSDNESLYKENQLSEDQIQILVSAGFDEDRIRRNDLTNVDYRIIEDYQYALNYLEEKYDGYNFSLIECSPGTKSTYSLFTGTIEGFPSESFDIQVSSSGDIRSARDNCYRIIKKEEYADLLQEVISCVEKECLDVELYFICRVLRLTHGSGVGECEINFFNPFAIEYKL